MKKILVLTFALLSLSSVAQTEVSQYVPGITAEGVTYFLPQTRLAVVVTAQRKTYVPGEYAKYAERYLRLNDVTKETYDSWKLMKVSLMSFGVADKTKAYTVRLNTKSSAPLVGLSSDGVLLSINTTAPEVPVLPQPTLTKDSEETINGADYKTEEILSAGSTLKMAELTAAEINDIREKRSTLIKGDADFMPKDGEQLKLMLAQLDKQETGLLQLFKGSSSTETRTFVFTYNPTKETKGDVLFRFSRFLGPVAPNDLSGAPVYISIKDLLSLPATAPVDPKQKKKEAEDVRYAVPGNVAVKVYDDKATYTEKTFPMAQFGRVEHLGGDLFNKKFTTKVTLYPETGGIMRLEGEPAGKN